ncbi:MAG: sel1 repeat family protein [Verrucomicrobia bacterium]|jgi:TPR repeat protein|nr:sel1 repeat family protein [Verrucomicrobiota bacterium]
MRILTIILSLVYANAFAQVTAFTEVTPEMFPKVKNLAEQGDSFNQWVVGECYRKGEGVSKDQAEAVKWFRKLAEQNNSLGQLSLGICYSNGEGVTKDPVEAVEWYRKSAEQENGLAQLCLGICYSNGEGVTKNPVEAVKWYHKAAKQGYADALNNLGICYSKGIGVLKDPVEAYACFNIAGITSELGRKNRDKLEKEMTPSQREAGLKRSKELGAQIEFKNPANIK